jgi:hypothetical protein
MTPMLAITLFFTRFEARKPVAGPQARLIKQLGSDGLAESALG